MKNLLIIIPFMFLFITEVKADNLADSSGRVSFSTGCRTADPDFPGFGQTIHLVGGELSFRAGGVADYINDLASLKCSGSYTLKDGKDGSEPIVRLKVNFKCNGGVSFYIDVMTPPVSTKSPALKGKFFSRERSFYMTSNIDRAVGKCNATTYMAMHILEP